MTPPHPRSPFLNLPREIRNEIYKYATLSCLAVENVTANHAFTDRPLLGTVLAIFDRKPPKRFVPEFRTKLSASTVLRMRQAAYYTASPGGLLLTNRRISAEFTEELHRHSKVVGYYKPQDDEPGSLPHLVFGTPKHARLHYVRHFELQLHVATMCPAPNHGMREQATKLEHLDSALGEMPHLRELTLRLMVSGIDEWEGLLRGAASRKILIDVMYNFFHTWPASRRELCVLKKLMTIAYGRPEEGELEPTDAAQMFPMKEMEERWDEERQVWTCVYWQDLSIRYIKFYETSRNLGYLWVIQQYQPYSLFGVRGSYDGTKKAMIYGYNKWIQNGQPTYKDTPEHAEMLRRCENQLPSLDREAWMRLVSEFAKEMGYETDSRGRPALVWGQVGLPAKASS